MRNVKWKCQMEIKLKPKKLFQENYTFTMKKKDMDLSPSMEQMEKQNLWNCQRWEGSEKR
jgi:hypothetical protein